MPEQLIRMGEVAKKYNLYTNVTGAQRIDLFGAAKHEVPDLWEELGRVGLESGHAYGKALRPTYREIMCRIHMVPVRGARFGIICGASGKSPQGCSIATQNEKWCIRLRP